MTLANPVLVENLEDLHLEYQRSAPQSAQKYVPRQYAALLNSVQGKSLKTRKFTLHNQEVGPEPSLPPSSGSRGAVDTTKTKGTPCGQTAWVVVVCCGCGGCGRGGCGGGCGVVVGGCGVRGWSWCGRDVNDMSLSICHTRMHRIGGDRTPGSQTPGVPATPSPRQRRTLRH